MNLPELVWIYCACFIKNHCTLGCCYHSLPNAGSIEAFNEGLHHLQVPGKYHKAKQQPTYKSIQKSCLILFSFGFRISDDSATMHKVFLEGNKCSLCGIVKLCDSLTFDSHVTVTSISRIRVDMFPIPPPPSIIYAYMCTSVIHLGCYSSGQKKVNVS